MKYKLWVSAIDGDYDKNGEYDGVEYDTIDEARYAKTIAEQDETLDIRITEVDYHLQGPDIYVESKVG